MTIYFITVLAIALAFQVIPYVHGEHDAEVIWWKAEVDNIEVGLAVGKDLYLKQITYPVWVYFNVTNSETSDHAIVSVRIAIPWNTVNDEAYFEFKDGVAGVAAENWRFDTSDPDPDGDPREIFVSVGDNGNSISPGSTGVFALEFKDGPDTCKHRFRIDTTDEEPQSKYHELFINIDGNKPKITLTHPLDNANVTAIWDPYPDYHYVKISGTANDPEDHFSGISLIEIYVNDTLWWSLPYDPHLFKDEPIEFEVQGNKTDAFPEEGWYRVCAKATDGAGNSANITHTFYLDVLGVGISISPDKGTVGPTTEKLDSGVYEGSIYEYPLANKVLGQNVTVTGAGFEPDSTVDVTVWAPDIYEDDELLVVKDAETDEDGNFEAWFLFPTLPQDTYEINAKDQEGFTALEPAYFTVNPQIIYKPVVVVGPAVIEVMATGLESYDYVDGFTIDGTDALMGTNLHVIDWRTKIDGVLFSSMAEKPGFLMPVLEPGTYEIGLDFEEGESISNVLHVINSFKDLSDAIDEIFNIEDKLDYLKPMIERIDDNVVWIRTTLGKVEGKIDDFTLTIDEINGTTVTILARLDDDVHSGETEWEQEIHGWIEQIKDDVAIIKTDIGDIKVNVNELKTALSETDDKVTDILSLVEDVPTQLTINIATVLSAISAIAAITAVVVVLRRLKVAA